MFASFKYKMWMKDLVQIMRIMKKIMSLTMVAVMAVTMTACGGDSSKKEDDNKLVIRYQKSIAYAPVMVMEEKNMIAKYYDKDVEVDCQVEKDGNTIKEGVSSGNIDVGTVGLPPAAVGILSGSKYKIFTGISAQPYSIVTNQKDIKTLKDLKDKNIQVGVLSTNSQGHILLGLAAKAELDDAHAFDNVLNPVDNASGFDGIKSGSIKVHVVISPYNFKELAVEGTHEIPVSKDVWVPGDTSIVGIASNDLYENNKDLYNAVCKALEEAMTYVKENPEETAKLVKEKLELDDSVEDIVTWMTDSRSQYSTELQGVGDFMNFMKDEGFLENEYSGNLSDLIYDGVKGN